MNLVYDLEDMARENGVSLMEENGELIFRGSGKERRLTISRLREFSADGLNHIPRWQICAAIKYANLG